MTRLLTITQAGRELGIGRTKAFELAGRGAIRTIRIGQRRFVPVGEIERIAEVGTR